MKIGEFELADFKGTKALVMNIEIRNITIKTLVILTISVLLFACVSAKTKMNTSLNVVYSGMTIQEFKNKVSNSTLVQMMDNFSCYKLEAQSAKFGEPGGYVYETRFFYFKDNKLYRIDEGTRATDLKIEIAKDISIHN